MHTYGLSALITAPGFNTFELTPKKPNIRNHNEHYWPKKFTNRLCSKLLNCNKQTSKNCNNDWNCMQCLDLSLLNPSTAEATEIGGVMIPSANNALPPIIAGNNNHFTLVFFN
jgi:hypothetical protein